MAAHSLVRLPGTMQASTQAKGRGRVTIKTWGTEGCMDFADFELHPLISNGREEDVPALYIYNSERGSLHHVVERYFLRMP